MYKNIYAAFEYDSQWLLDGFSISPFSLPLEKWFNPTYIIILERYYCKAMNYDRIKASGGYTGIKMNEDKIVSDNTTTWLLCNSDDADERRAFVKRSKNCGKASDGLIL